MKQRRYFVGAERSTSITPESGVMNTVTLRETVEFEIDAFNLKEAVDKATTVLDALDEGYELFEITELEENDDGE